MRNLFIRNHSLMLSNIVLDFLSDNLKSSLGGFILVIILLERLLDMLREVTITFFLFDEGLVAVVSLYSMKALKSLLNSILHLVFDWNFGAKYVFFVSWHLLFFLDLIWVFFANHRGLLVLSNV